MEPQKTRRALSIYIDQSHRQDRATSLRITKLHSTSETVDDNKVKFKIQTPPPVPSDDPQDLDLFAYASAISNTGEKNKNKTKLIAT